MDCKPASRFSAFCNVAEDRFGWAMGRCSLDETTFAIYLSR
jgi:hypothetical protein